MSSEKNGGPAFPVVGMSQFGQQPVMTVFTGGMTLRQYYKAAALTGLCACPNVTGNDQKLANAAGFLADAMLAEDEEHAKK